MRSRKQNSAFLATMKNVSTKFFFSLLCLLLLCSAPVSAQNKNNLEKERKALHNDINKTSKQLTTARANKRNALSALKKLRSSIDEQSQSLDSLRSQLQALEERIVENKSRADQLSEGLGESRKEYKTLLVQLYQYRRAQEKMHKSQTTSRRLLYLKSLEHRRRNILKELSVKYLVLTKTNQTLEKEYQQKEEVLEQKAQLQANLSESLNEKDKLLKQLSQKEHALYNTLKAKQRRRNQLNRKIESVIRNEIAASRAANRSTTTSSSPAAKAKASPATMKAYGSAFAAQKGRMSRPASGTVVGYYGRHPHPEYPMVIVENNGIDIKTAAKAPVKAIADGEVVSVFSIPGAHQAVMLRHGDFYTTYSNIEAVAVRSQQQVKAGTRLGAVAKDQQGRYVLHFEVWRGKSKENPLSWVR